jgi:hypothetical protein
MWSFIGIETATVPAENVINPQENYSQGIDCISVNDTYSLYLGEYCNSSFSSSK